MGWDFFVSYTSADRAWAEWIAWELEHDGHRVLVQAWDFVPGADWVARMHEAVQGAERTIAVLSSAYLSSAYGRAEWQAAWRDDPLGDRRKLLVLRVEDCARPGLLGSVTSEDLFGLGEAAARQRVREAVRGALTGRARPATPPAFPGTSPRFPGVLPEVWHVPPRNPHFTGRAEQLAALHRTSGTVSVHAVRGMGGVGKSQLAIEYAHRYAAGFDVVWWVPSEQPAAVPQHFAALASALGHTAPGDPVAAVHAVLRRHKRWLLIFDNAEDPDDLRPHLPHGPGLLIITTRRAGFDALGRVIDLDPPDRADSTALIGRRLPHATPGEADALADLLGDLPLAIEQAAAYVTTTGVPVATYADLVRTRAAEMLAEGRVVGRDETLASLWDLSLATLTDRHPAARHLLDVLAHLAPEPVPLALFTRNADLLPAPLADVVADPIALNRAVGALVDHYFVRRTGDDVTVVHRLLRQSLRSRTGPAPFRTAVELVAADAVHRAPGGWWPRWPELLPHVLAVTEDNPHSASSGPDITKLLSLTSSYLVNLGRARDAEPPAARAVAMAEDHHGPDHPRVAGYLRVHARALRALGRDEEARRLLERAIALRTAERGPDDIKLGEYLTELGIVLRLEGRTAEARRVLERALAIHDAADDPAPTWTSALLDALAHTTRDEGDLEAAEKIYRRAVDVLTAAEGDHRPPVAGLLGNHAAMLLALGRAAEGEQLVRRSIAITDSVHGPDHPRSAIYWDLLSAVLRDLGDDDGADAAQERARRLREG
ncbi:FxSxx-COOH system tetratricopeptide repeat protein [Saccharothrix saharensis]|uniref:FxSxx-COOH system tetratricopeptide repeat protein n=1 Tax=Saccharothrix saharensis TaxID=571190 RepID=UPI00368DBDA6